MLYLSKSVLGNTAGAVTKGTAIQRKGRWDDAAIYLETDTDRHPLTFCTCDGDLFSRSSHSRKSVPDIGNVLRGDLGVSYQDPATRVTEIIARAWPVTASIGITALAVSVLLGTGLGILRAVTKRRFVRELISAGGMLAAGIPGFAAAILLLLVFSVKLKWLPASGLLSPAHYILPVTALSLYPAAMITRLVGNTLDMELQKDYVLFARAKGMGKWQIIFTHALKNAYLPVLNYIGPASASLLTGSFVIESIFTIPGLGREFVGSITNRDYTLILGLTVFMGAVVIIVNLLTDLLCAWLDPQTRRAYKKAGDSAK